MTQIDARGTQVDYQILASAGIYRTYTAQTSAGAAYDLTGKTVTVDVKDDCEPESYAYSQTYVPFWTDTMTVTSAGDGEFTLLVPPGTFSGKEGARLSHETYITNSDGSRIGLMWGYIDVQERG